MSQRSSTPSTQESSVNPLHPTLKSVLGSLDINLEKELTQYRRHRKRGEQWIPPARRHGVSLGNVGGETSGSLNLPDPSLKPPLSPQENLLLSGNQENPVSPSALVLTSGENQGTVGDKPATLETGLAPEKNLDSTEALLKTVEKSKTPSPSEESFLGSLFSPLGIFSMFLFVLSCAALGYAIRPTIPSLLTYFGLNSLLKSSSGERISPPSSLINSSQSVLPKSPNLITKEFIELDLSTLSNVPPRGRPFPSPTPLTAASTPPSLKPIPTVNISNPVGVKASPESGLNNLGKALLTSPSPTISPRVTTNSITPSPLPQTRNQPLPSPQIQSTPLQPIQSSDGFYYVVIDFDGEQSLQRARQVVSDAYLRNFAGRQKIQLGALNTPQEAETLVRELRSKGMSAYYQP